ncbi:MAG: PHP domain-containing protein [Thermoplasmata archaeon]|uniref:PHP domain-containing protein n=1 Tax=Candidatus Sysuiplasma superficiale TaxID=2823368 RepID=A0A8J7YPT1_9ARCH|nr:PHP domain-containing protein [Candidatus Sysuiplasma superficiale]MBX8644295.1 PHP domain-containing protein [Candidatus Sysuiplasma superficiale]MCL4346827.1 PHP domain-containing protein [Candidatus Thermoplasmatota archaeon]MCL5437367.1 PHP domain-containing protein [Candidatus Thermoplasmatota archaeon]
MKIDAHTHSLYSPDSMTDVGTLLKAAILAGMDAIAVTDHNTVRGSIAALSMVKTGIVVITGCELSTADGHLLCLGIREDIPRGIAMAEAVEKVQELGGVAVPSHPFRMGTGAGQTVLKGLRVNAIETVNGRNHSSRNRRAELFARAAGMGETGGSDSHFPHEAGRAYTVVEGEGLSQSDILQSIGSGKSRAEGRGQSVAGSVRTTIKIVREYAGRRGKHI